MTPSGICWYLMLDLNFIRLLLFSLLVLNNKRNQTESYWKEPSPSRQSVLALDSSFFPPALKMFRSDNDMSMSMSEPRIQRPFLHNHQQGLHMLPPQVSEPSLFSEDISFPFKEVFQPRSTVSQTSPVKSPGFIPQLTPLSVLKKTSSWPQKTSPCGCKTSPFNNSAITSPSVDPEIKELIQDQNRQLNLLQTQVKQLLHYQERLQDKLGEKERANGATQTSSYFDDESPNYNPSPVRVCPRSNNGSPSMRQPQDRTEITLTFRDLQLETIVEQPPSPQPSFVVNMQDYQESVSEEFDDSIDSCVNVMEHVQKLLAQANTKEVQRPLMEKPREMLHVLNEVPERLLFNGSALPDNPVRKVTMQRVQELGISFINPFPAK
ncbi:hypothetical protein DAPPUDRAFT_116989 [Daphnia pulex]|uniref:Uncharacterized protein n=1 Tax=Daphnia pulex TaxID=6669 RepID=E9HR69_DAPPU|nr:hypothetical protein DAPPUDRAFT_116989 [Daphnia pulex]|eukprot:EFX65732.1 hypothetical protein DAPPUDRAFT_116989 [Daphnia pulex]